MPTTELIDRPTERPAGTESVPASRVPPDRVSQILLIAGAVLLPWAVSLLRTVPASSTVVHWNVAWTGLDLLEVAALVTAGLLRRRDDPRQLPALIVAATAIGLDAWFDVLTAAGGADRALALAMLPVELAAGGGCVALALGAWRRWVPRDLSRRCSAAPPHAAPRRGSTSTGRWR